MKTTFSGPVASLLALTLLLPAIASATVCSNANLQGTYAFVSQSLGALSRMGMLSADGNGNFTETFTISQNGGIAQNQTASGTYTVNTDCTGFLATAPLFDYTAFALLGGGESVLTNTPSPFSNFGGVGEIGQMQRIWLRNHSLGTCSLATFKGGFLGQQQGVTAAGGINPSPGVPSQLWVSVIGDGLGNTAEALLSGSTSGTYTVNADCTGTLTFANPLGNSETWDFVISGNGRTIYAIRTDSGPNSISLFAVTMVVNRL